ncbi:agmatinase [Pasteurellaceae bacterium HPA106]|uniref:agmatinase n=1 Tax=Spirabiliibacterium pneumoniae TaxID=221400 RepID=UPI001AAD5D22|nr:agmatinase [Spirabiliibacterium pneumoniae]MBE2897027.1 agmatinase [Spirabiliibacterium pneumoniae]
MNTLNHAEDISLVSNNFGFLRLPLNFTPYQGNADWVITGVPFDQATSGRAGTRSGAEAIRRASVNLAWEHCRFPWDFDVRERLKIEDCGDLVYAFGDNADFVQKLEQHASQLLKCGKKCLTFGGDHFITLPLLRAHAKHFGKLALLHFDAHTDTYDNGSDYDHGTMFYHAPKEGLIDAARSIQIGIRTEYDRTLPFTVLDAPTANDMSAADIVAKIKHTVGDMPVYLTFDIDCLDPAYAPGTGTPVIGGMTPDKILKILRQLQGVNIVGMDIVEVSPAFDQSQITALAGATLALEMLYLQGSQKENA